jgi:lipase
VPLTPPDRSFVDVEGIRLCWFEWPAATEAGAAEPPVLLVHANGFHARCWDRVVAHLGDRRVVALDQRGHGRSEKRGPFAWRTYGGDLTAFAGALGLSGAVGVGHSMGGHALVQAAAARPDAFSRLVLIDPVILPPDAYEHRSVHGHRAEDHPVARRKDHWRGWEEMVERFRDRVPFSLWEPAVLEDYCRHGLLPAEPDDPDGPDGYRLACPPLVEAANYTMSDGADVYGDVARVPHPVVLLRARGRTGERDPLDFTGSPTWSELAERFPDCRDVYLPELTHFIPMQAPALTAEYVLGLR